MRLPRLLPVAVAAALFAVVAGAAGGGSGAERACGWRTVAHTGVPSLSAVVALSPTDVWAVGKAIVHWDGHELAVVQPSWPADTEFAGVSGRAVSDVWAVGTRGTFSKQQGVVVHWDGSAWSVVPTPQRPRAMGFHDVVASSPSDVWVVGESDESWRLRPLVMHWNGAGWRLFDVRKLVPKPDDEFGTYLDSIDAASPDDVWVTGTRDANDFGGYQPVVLHWNGGAWSTRTLPPSKFQGLASVDVDALARGSAVALETYTMEAGGDRLVRWTIGVPTALELNTPDVSLSGLAATSATSGWLVGARWNKASTSRPLVLHWEGRTLRAVATPFASLRNATLSDLSLLSKTEIWAVGDHLIARYSCPG